MFVTSRMLEYLQPPRNNFILSNMNSFVITKNGRHIQKRHIQPKDDSLSAVAVAASKRIKNASSSDMVNRIACTSNCVRR